MGTSWDKLGSIGRYDLQEGGPKGYVVTIHTVDGQKPCNSLQLWLIIKPCKSYGNHDGFINIYRDQGWNAGFLQSTSIASPRLQVGEIGSGTHPVDPHGRLKNGIHLLWRWIHREHQPGLEWLVKMPMTCPISPTCNNLWFVGLCQWLKLISPRLDGFRSCQGKDTGNL